MKQSGMRPGGESMHRRRIDYPPPGPPDLKRRFSPGRDADMRARKRMRCVSFPVCNVVHTMCQGEENPFFITLFVQLVCIFKKC